MPRSGAISLGLAVLCALAAADAAGGQSVGVDLGWQRTGGPDFPGGPGVSLDATVPASGLFGLRASVGRWWGTDTRLGTLCTGFLPANVGCLQEDVEHRSAVTAVEGFLLARPPSLGALSMTLGLGLGHYSVDVSRYGRASGQEDRPVAASQSHRWVPAFSAELEVHPRSWGGLGVTLGARTASVEFAGLVADAWGLSGALRLTRLSAGGRYRLR